jgi:hypothetical protein
MSLKLLNNFNDTRATKARAVQQPSCEPTARRGDSAA